MDSTLPGSKVPVAHNIGELAAALPTIVGFRPENSVIAVCVDPRTRRLAETMRVDLPSRPADLTHAANLLASHINRHAPLKVILFAVTPDEEAGRKVVSLVENSVGAASVIGAARLDEGRYWNLLAPHPLEGRPIRPGPFSEQVTEFNVIEGRHVFPTRADMEAAYAPASDELQYQTARAIMRVAEKIQADAGEHGWDHVLIPVRKTAFTELTNLLDDPSHFNTAAAAWLTVASGFPPIRDDMRRQITRENALQHAETWRMVAIHAPGTTAASAYALSAFANWLGGDGAQASIAVGQALRCNPEDRLANATHYIVANGVNPNHWNSPTRDQ